MTRERGASRRTQPRRGHRQQTGRDEETEGSKGSPEGRSKDKGSKKQWPPWLVMALFTIAIGIPRGLQLGYQWVHLQSGWLRAPVGLNEDRPLLVVGTMGRCPHQLTTHLQDTIVAASASGTKQMSVELGKLGLEVAHEASDTTSRFARDGTISWLHGLRLLEGSAGAGPTVTLCSEPRFHAFHPTMFRPTSKCSYYTLWSSCWATECRDLWTSEFGCETRGGACTNGFTTKLLQVRHPLRTISSLIAKSLPDCSNAKHQLAVVEAMFPAFPWASLSTCHERWGWYWILYIRAMLPRVDEWYRVEDTPPCRVAQLGGLLGGSATAEEACRSRGEGQGPGQGEEHGYYNTKNLKREVVTWQFMDLFPNNLSQQMRGLAEQLGYT